MIQGGPYRTPLTPLRQHRVLVQGHQIWLGRLTSAGTILYRLLTVERAMPELVISDNGFHYPLGIDAWIWGRDKDELNAKIERAVLDAIEL